MTSRRRFAALALAPVLALAGLALAAAPSSADSGPAGCPAGSPDQADCVLPPTNGTPVSPAPVISWSSVRQGNETSEVGTFTATFTPPYKECPDPGAIAYGDMPCMESRTLSVETRLYVPGAAEASTDGVGSEPVQGGTCTITSCDLRITLETPYIGAGTLLVHYSELAVVNGGQFEDHSFDLVVPGPASPVLGIAHVVKPFTAFKGAVRGSKRVKLTGHGIPSSAQGLFTVVTTTYPTIANSPGETFSESEIVKGNALRVEADRRATVTVTVTGWLDGKAGTSDALYHRVTQTRVKGTSAKPAGVPSDATGVVVSFAAANAKSSTVGGVPMAGEVIGAVVPLSHGKLALKLAKGAAAYVEGYFEPAHATDAGSQLFVGQTATGDQFFGLSYL